MKILSIDTSSNICAVAILEDTKLIKEISLDNGLTHSEKLMPIIQQILTETSISLSDIDILICDKGPGSFTGIRIGVSSVLAFSDSLEIPSYGISSLEALAYNVQTPGIICSLVDAKHSNCYCGIFKFENGKYNLVEDLFAESIDNILTKLQNYNEPICFVGSGAVVNREIISENIINCKFTNANDLSAYKLGLAGFNSYLSNNTYDVSPLYLKKSQAEQK